MDCYIESGSIADISDIKEHLNISSNAEWFDDSSKGQCLTITVPENGSWFTYDDKMNCIDTSLSKNSQSVVTLPENGRIVFVGDKEAKFKIVKEDMK